MRYGGDTLEELKKNMAEALNVHLDEPDNTNLTFPLPDKKKTGRNILEVPVLPKVSFALAMRSFRKRKGLTQREIAKLLGLKNLYSYQRLERSKYANPSLTTLVKIKSAFPDFKIDEILLSEPSEN